MEKWAEVKGDLDLAKKTLEDLEEKHDRRWTELVSQFLESNSTHASVSTSLREDGANSNGNSADIFTTTKKIAELESKLQQALEAVSRMDTLRTTLADAYKMNEQLQSKLEDLRAKNAKMVAEKVTAREKIKEVETSTAPESLTSPPASSKKPSAGSSSSSSDPIIEKLQQNYRRARKEFSAAVLSKDQAKLKQEVRCLMSLLHD
jgi:E3 ubiquitin-protein ligase BRE1